MAEVVADDAEVAGRVRELVDDRRDPEHDAERRALMPPHFHSAPPRVGVAAPLVRASTPSMHHGDERQSPPISPRYEMCVCMHIDPAMTATGSIARSSASTDHTASRNTNHHSTGRYGFHGSVRRNAPYARVSTASTAAIASEERTAAAPQRHPEREPHRDDVEHDGRREQPVRRAAEELPDRPQRVEAQRSRDGCRRSVRTDRCDRPARSAADVPGDVADADLGLRHVEQRVPVRPPQLDERDEEREREHGEQRRRTAARVSPRDRRRSGCGARRGRPARSTATVTAAPSTRAPGPSRTGD